MSLKTTLQSIKDSIATGIVNNAAKLGGFAADLYALKTDVSSAISASGGGNMVGPNSSVAGHVVVFSDTAGKVTSDGGAVDPAGTAATKANEARAEAIAASQPRSVNIVGYPDYNNYTGYAANTAYTAPYSGWLSVIVENTYIGSIDICAGTAYHIIASVGDDINSNTKRTSNLIPIAAGQPFLIRTPGTYGSGSINGYSVESIQILLYPAMA